jgi:hypothetical protein
MSQDTIWKEAIEQYFEDFLLFFFPDIREDVDLERGYQFLDKELAEIIGEGETGQRFADCLIKVFLKNGLERWLVIHIEVQGYLDPDFARRMFIYNYRTFDRYNVDFWKITLVKALYERGYGRTDILRSYRFIDGLIALPEEMTTQFHQEIVSYEEERKVAYITTAERIGFEKGVQQGIQQGIEQGIQQGIRQGLLKAIEMGLELKFGSEGLRLYPEIRRIEDPDILEAISEGIKVAQTLAEVERIYKPES